MHRLLRCDVDQIGNVLANGVLAVFIESSGKPNRRAVGQRAKASVEMIKTRIDKFHRDDETAEHLRDRAMRFDVGPEFVTAKKCVADEKCIAFAFEIKIIGQPGDLEAALFHPAGKMRRLAGALFVPKIAWDKLFAHSESGVGGENHVRQLWLRRDELNSAIQFGKGRVQPAPLLLRDRCFRPARSAHPGIDLVLDAVVIRRAKKEFAHKMTVTYRRVEGVLLLRPARANVESVRPTRAGSGP